MKKLLICSAALIALAISPVAQAQNGGNRDGQRQGQKHSGEMRKLMKESMAIVHEEMKSFRKDSKEGYENFWKSQKDKSVAETIAAIKSRRSSRFTKANSSFKSAIQKAKAHFESGMANIENISEERKAKALERFDKIEKRRSEKSAEIKAEQIAFLDSLANNPSLTKKELHQKLKAHHKENMANAKEKRDNHRKNRKNRNRNND